MRKKIVAGNWKMNKLLTDAEQTAKEVAETLSQNKPDAEVWIAPPSIFIEKLANDQSSVDIGLQDISIHDEGAFTGEVSAPMAASVGAKFALVGHSERRQYHNEDDVLIHQKILACLRHNLTAVYCCGESLDERKAGKAEEVVGAQIREALIALSADAMKNVVVAYEPVWAIGTGETASSQQAQDMHAFIRNQIRTMFDDATADDIRILYGGSVKPGNAAELFSEPDIDGGLIGGASLKAVDFLQIVAAAN